MVRTPASEGERALWSATMLGRCSSTATEDNNDCEKGGRPALAHRVEVDEAQLVPIGRGAPVTGSGWEALMPPSFSVPFGAGCCQDMLNSLAITGFLWW